MKEGYEIYVENQTVPMCFDMWRVIMEKKHPQFNFWSTTIKFQLTVFLFVRSIREKHFSLYKEALNELMKWFFALDHPNYARWLSIHIRDMQRLSTIHPNIAAQFAEGKFVVQKTLNRFSAIAIDHAHEPKLLKEMVVPLV